MAVIYPPPTALFPFFQLPDLVQRKLFRQYLSIEDKAGVLSLLPEFSPWLERRTGLWPSDAHYYYYQLFCFLPQGWYANPEDIFHEQLFHVTYDEASLSLTLSSFFVGKIPHHSPVAYFRTERDLTQVQTFLNAFRKIVAPVTDPVDVHVYFYVYDDENHNNTRIGNYIIVRRDQRTLRCSEGKRYTYGSNEGWVLVNKSNGHRCIISGPGISHQWRKQTRWLRVVLSEEEEMKEPPEEEDARYILVKNTDLNDTWERLEPLKLEQEKEVDATMTSYLFWLKMEKEIPRNSQWTFQLHPSKDQKVSVRHQDFNWVSRCILQQMFPECKGSDKEWTFTFSF